MSFFIEMQIEVLNIACTAHIHKKIEIHIPWIAV